MQTLTVVNECLGSMGELPLNSLTDTHAMLPSALAKLDLANRRIQAKGWWFNMEEIKLTPNVVDDSIYLPNDTLEVRTDEYNVVMRNGRLYNLKGGSYEWTSDITVILIRLVPFEDLPELAGQYIGAEAVVEFQQAYDGDSTKTRALSAEAGARLIEANIAHTRNRRSNLILSNPKLMRLKQLTNGARRFIR